MRAIPRPKLPRVRPFPRSGAGCRKESSRSLKGCTLLCLPCLGLHVYIYIYIYMYIHVHIYIQFMLCMRVCVYIFHKHQHMRSMHMKYEGRRRNCVFKARALLLLFRVYSPPYTRTVSGYPSCQPQTDNPRPPTEGNRFHDAGLPRNPSCPFSLNNRDNNSQTPQSPKAPNRKTPYKDPQSP